MRSAPPGRLVNVGTHRLHLLCAGDGVPSIVLDSALGGSSLSWSLVQPSLARVARTCAYDRGGFGWSDAGPMPRTASRIAGELFDLLRHGAVPPPYVLVGHSFGGLVTRLFTARHRDLVAGLVLIEPAIVEEWADPSADRRALVARGTRLCRYGAWAARHRIARVVSALVQAGSHGAARALVAAVSRGHFRREDEAILAPIWKLPVDARRHLGAMWTEPTFFEALGSQIETISESARVVSREASGEYGELPMAVVTSDAASPARHAADATLAARSTRGRHVVARNSGHWIPLDAPDAVVQAVTSVLMQARARF
jgi:pimeloyl-ACP methyl ester carboxylesterase